VEPDHDVDFEGPCVVLDTVDAQVGEMVVVAIAPLGDSFDIPRDLPIHGAVVGVVGSMTAPAEDDEGATESDGGHRRQGDAPRRDTRRSGASGGGRSRQDRGPSGAAEEPVAEAPAEPPASEEAVESEPPKREAAKKKAAKKKPAAKKAAKKPAEKKAAKKTTKKSRSRSSKEEPVAAAKDASSSGADDLLIVWDAPGSESVGDTTKRKAPRRRR